jgi:hypothetical protein
MLSTAQAALIVVPNNRATVEGNNGNGAPFTIPTRVQQVYASSQFSSLGGPALITQLAFRPDAPFGNPAVFTISNIEIDLSTTNASPDGLSTTFASNIGPDVLTVFSGPLSMTTADTGPAAGPKDFDVIINIAPFLYDPSSGNLLLDVRNFSSALTGTALDAEAVLGDSVSRVFSTTGATSSTGTADTLALVTRFTITPVSAPGTLALLVLALATMVPVRWATKAMRSRVSHCGRAMRAICRA